MTAKAQQPLNNAESIDDVIDAVVEKVEAENGDKVEVRKIYEALGTRSFGPMLLLIGLFASIPITGGIPGASILSATLIILVAGQMMIGRRTLWLPERLLNAKLNSEKVCKAGDEIERYTDYVNWAISPRLTWLSKPPFTMLWASILVLLAITMYPLEIVPLGVLPAALTVTILAIGLTMKDGIFLLIGSAMALAALYVTWILLF